MTDFEAEERRLLDAARRAFEPTRADASRVLEATRDALAAAAFVGATSAASRAAAQGGLFQSAGGAWLSKVLAALCVAGASAGVGYYTGFHAGTDSRGERAPAPRVAHTSSPPARRAPLEGPNALPAPSARAELPPAPVHTSEPSMRPMRTRTGATRAPHSLPAPPEPSLEREARMLAGVERALREHDPQRALVLLGELDRELPGGALAEERSAAFMIARCSLGLGSPAQLVTEFARRYPSSVYFPRVRRSCAAGEDPDLPRD